MGGLGVVFGVVCVPVWVCDGGGGWHGIFLRASWVLGTVGILRGWWVEFGSVGRRVKDRLSEKVWYGLCMVVCILLVRGTVPVGYRAMHLVDAWSRCQVSSR
jgi:hypothetical protein